MIKLKKKSQCLIITLVDFNIPNSDSIIAFPKAVSPRPHQPSSVVPSQAQHFPVPTNSPFLGLNNRLREIPQDVKAYAEICAKLMKAGEEGCCETKEQNSTRQAPVMELHRPKMEAHISEPVIVEDQHTNCRPPLQDANTAQQVTNISQLKPATWSPPPFKMLPALSLRQLELNPFQLTEIIVHQIFHPHKKRRLRDFRGLGDWWVPLHRNPLQKQNTHAQNPAQNTHAQNPAKNAS
jgi:hypothetical protein